MRVVLLSPNVTAATLTRAAALERDPIVSWVQISDEVRTVSEADVVILEGTVLAGRVMPGLRLGPGKVIVLADRLTSAEKVALLDVGADLVLHGEVSDEEVVAQIRAIARPRAAPAAQVGRCTRTKLVLEGDRRHAVVVGRRITLTLLEANLLAAFLARPNEVLSGHELLTSAWGAPIAARSTVSASIRRLRLKIEPDPSNPIFIRTVWGGGYIYRPEGEG